MKKYLTILIWKNHSYLELILLASSSMKGFKNGTQLVNPHKFTQLSLILKTFSKLFPFP